MVKSFVCLLLLTTILLEVVECYGRGKKGGGGGGRCKIRTTRQKAKIQDKINSCLLVGYTFSYIEGCQSYKLRVSIGGRLNKKMKRKCRKAEKSMKKCGFTCSKYE